MEFLTWGCLVETRSLGPVLRQSSFREAVSLVLVQMSGLRQTIQTLSSSQGMPPRPSPHLTRLSRQKEVNLRPDRIGGLSPAGIS